MHFATKTTFETQEPKKSGQWLAKPLRHVGIYATWSLPSCACYTVQMATSADWKVTTIDPKESTHPCLNCKEIGFGRPVKSKRACSSVHSNHVAILKFDTRSILHCWGGHHWKYELGILQLSRAIVSRCRLPSTLWLTWLSGQLSFKLTELLEPPLTFPDILVCTSHSSKRPDFAFCSVVAWNPLDRIWLDKSKPTHPRTGLLLDPFKTAKQSCRPKLRPDWTFCQRVWFLTLMHFATKTTFETQEPKKSGQWLAKPLRHVGIYATWSLPSCACYTVQMATSADWKVTTIDPKESTHPCLNCKEIGFGRPVKSKRACSSVHSNHAAILKFDTRSILHCWGGHHWKHELGILQLSRAILSRCRLPSTLWLTWLSGQLSFKLTELLEPPLTFPDILVCTSHSSKRPDFAFCSVVAWNPLDRIWLDKSKPTHPRTGLLLDPFKTRQPFKPKDAPNTWMRHQKWPFHSQDFGRLGVWLQELWEN